MVRGRCHCGAVRYVFRPEPEAATSCNCSYCRRAGALWIYATSDEVELSYGPEAVVRYVHGDRRLAFVSCATCGCTTHWEPVAGAPDARMAVNLRMADPAAAEGLRIRRFDGAESWRYVD